MSFFLCCCSKKRNKASLEKAPKTIVKQTILMGRSNTLEAKIKIFQQDTQPTEESEKRPIKFNTLKSIRFRKSHPLQNYVYPRDI